MSSNVLGPELSSSTVLAADPEASAQARWFLSMTAARGGWSLGELDVASLLTTEVVSNAVRHGSPVPGAPIELTVTVAGPLLRVIVRDQGPGFDPAGLKVGDTAWGISLIRDLASRWGIEPIGSGTEVWFELLA